MDQITFLTQIIAPAFASGLVMTVALILVAAPFGFLLGCAVAVGRAYGSPGVKLIAKGFVIFCKGCPLLLLLFILYFGMPSIGIVLTPFVASVIGFICCNAAYNSEYIRGAIHAIKDGQMTAAQALGMSKWQAVRWVVLPQALRKAFPGITNEFIYLVKYSSLAYMITLIELTGAAKMIATKYFMYNETFLCVGIVYLMLVTITTIAAHFIEKKYAIPSGQAACSPVA
ncbi:amino acid ABC transporter permease [Methanoregula sp. UBA64]|jgi:polar amino acid transport system permease protein|uniref:amino acid ABC transporter permease n=1 Tax=Methanoregula sp. UBA64 TaxID=1915554 RepID=UPI0025DAED33|nr:amino acid ABC transporter permease [Methanoregula sp. UBA64]